MIKDQTHLTFSDSNFVSKLEGGLNLENAVSYFALSDFYDKNCINQKCFDQHLNFYTENVKFTGIEYTAKYEGDVIVIIKSWRELTNTMPIGYYYIYNSVIYQSPNLSSVLSTYTQTISTHFLNAIECLNEKEEKEKEVKKTK
ncbi:MAG: mediator of RNA polymerase II transcription subunit 6 [archaeon]|nr:mediator of RNA polymerase II transcription subunit 6 [archaeon]